MIVLFALSVGTVFGGQDTAIDLRFPIPVERPDGTTPPARGMQGAEPYGVTTTVEFDPRTNQYILERRMGNFRLGGQPMNFEEFSQFDLQRSIQDYWRAKNAAGIGQNRGLLSDLMPAFRFSPDDLLSQVMGGGLFEVSVNGSVELILGFIRTRRDDPAIDIRNQRRTDLNFDARVEMNLNARIGNNFDLRFNHNTEAMFAFDNQFRLQWEGDEDNIIKNIQAGNVSFPLPTTLIHGAQSLFGISTRLQFGNTFVSAVVSEQRSETRHIQLQGGAQTIRFEFKADQYEDDRHFFIGHYFRDTYNHAMSMLPIINSQINILKIEVWVTNIGAPVTNNRNIVAFTDLGEANPNNPNLRIPGGPARPSDGANRLFERVDREQLRNINAVSNYFAANFGEEFILGRDFERIENARRLNDNEFTFNRQLGFISLNSRLSSDQVLAVAFQYQIIGDPTETIFQVGEFSDQGINAPDALMVKLLRSSRLDTRGSLWQLMMKNVYNLNAFQVSPEDFRLNILFAGDDQGIKTGFFKDNDDPLFNHIMGVPLIELFGMDRMDSRQNPGPDGVFDFIDHAATTGGLIESSTGRIFLPFIEPFGNCLVEIFRQRAIAAGRDPDASAAIAERYVFRELYENTRAEAQQFPTRNKFYFEGSFRSAVSNEISLGSMNVPHGSVSVRAGNTPLVEGVDFTVDYMLGTVRIINEGILNSGVPINITSENNSMFNIMTRRMLGLRVEHLYNRNLTFGGTFMNLHQSPITQKVTFGEAPINNTIWGFDVTYSNESRFLTRMVDRILPFQPSLTTSRLNLYGEFAHFIPGHSRAIGRTGTIYIDDFEGSKSSINLRDHLSWTMASTPQHQRDLFPESDLGINLATRFNAAHLSWYIIDRIFYDDRVRPRGINRYDLSDHATREVLVAEIFPNRELDPSQDRRLSVLNLHFDPRARGPYNFDVAGIPGVSHGIYADGSLRNPRSRWGGIQRRIDNTDFESANVEYIEFWLMDPFASERDAGRPLPRGGNLYFNLGDISEDVLRDGRMSFEHGLPTVRYDLQEISVVDTTIWGRVPRLQSLVNAFDSDPNSRQFQDIGLDGLNNEDERSFFYWFLENISQLHGSNSPAFNSAWNDPSSDDFRHFLGGYLDDLPEFIPNTYPPVRNRRILERYRYFTRPEGNSPSSAQTSEDFRQQQTTRPNTEDINNDNTLNEAENYFQYRVQLRPEMMMEVGQNYITDIQRAPVTLRDGRETHVYWYQFKIPIRSPDRVVGQIQNFQSIRFIRMFLQGWDEEVVLRFGTLELVRSEWRRYNHHLFEDGAYLTVSPNDQTEFDITTVNIEENSNRFPIPYVTPPGIERQINYGTINNILMNEQALSMRILNLADGDARAIHRLMDLDLRQFGYLRMFAHAQQVFENDCLKDDDVHLFIRLGSDFKDNYYEFSIPLKLTPWGARSARDIWPLENEVALDLERMVRLKESRNRHFRQLGSAISFSTPYSETDTVMINNVPLPRTYTVVGSPSLSSINTIMIGVRNPRRTPNRPNDDGRPKSVEVWINELRVTDFNHKSGWAATGRAQAFLGDLGTVSISGSHTTANFGQLETRITELQQDHITSFDFSVNLELGRFLPREAGLRIPVHFDYSRSLSNPEFNPLDPDIRTRRDLETWPTEEQRDHIRYQIQDEVIRQNINFINVRRERTNMERTPRIYDISNFTFSYSYSQMRARNVDIEYHNRDVHRGGFTYAYTFPVRTITPFANTAMAQNRWLALLTDFNFNPLPRSIAFNTEMMREFSEMRLRDKTPEHIQILIRPTYFKRFDWLRGYDLRWDLTRSLQFGYSAAAIAIIDEPLGGRIDTRERRDSVWQSIFSLGTMRNFNQTADLVWTIPINRIPVLDWVSATASYNSTFRFEGAMNAMADLGNTIENANTQAFRTTLDFVRLYNRSPLLRGINTPRRTTPQRPQPSRPGQQQQQPPQEQANETWETLYRGFLRMLMGFRNVSFDYRVINGILLPGFMGSPTILGTDFATGLPGLPFAFGSTRDIRQRAAEMDLISRDSLQNRPFMQKHTRTINVNALFEPFVDLRVQLNAGKTETRNRSEFFRYDPTSGEFRNFMPQMGGNFQITTIAIRTAFISDRSNRESPVFETFLSHRRVVAERLADGNPHSTGMVRDSATGLYFPVGYGPTSQQVLLPAFIAAYLGQNPHNISLSAFPRIPLPNWNITYTGLTRIPFFRQHFNRIRIQHGYSARYTIGAYARNMLFGHDDDGVPNIDFSNNFIGENSFENILISEQFNPLLGINVEMRNNFQVNAEMRRSRNLGLSFTNNQLTESRNEDWIFSIGYVFRDIGFNVISGQSRRNIRSDINVRAGVSIRSNITMLRRIDQPVNLVSAGSRITTLNFSADYQLSQHLTVRLFYDQQMNRPHLPTMFFNSTTSGGISLRFTINQ
ncbi:MAG: cell surface protein SprA [Bacteroidales bacterium]|nr:cell surface protein SprA [Bacteroidales bacterium]